MSKTTMTKIAQVGAGYWGKNLVRNFAQLGALAAIVEPNSNFAGGLSEEFDVPIRTLDEVLKDISIDGISFATPAETHAELALKAIAADKDVFVEKPLALSVKDAENVIAKAADANKIVMVGHLLKYHPIFVHVQNMVESGILGKLQYIYSNRMGFGKFRTEEDVWWSFAPHDITMVLALAGEEPSSLTAQGVSCVSPGLADWVTAQATFKNGIHAHFNISWMHPFKEQRLTVVGEKGMLVFEDSKSEWNEKLAFYPLSSEKRSDGSPLLQKADVQYIEVKRSEPLKTECQHFIDCISTRQQPKSDGVDGLRVLKVLQQGAEAFAETSKTSLK